MGLALAVTDFCSHQGYSKILTFLIDLYNPQALSFLCFNQSFPAAIFPLNDTNGAKSGYSVGAHIQYKPCFYWVIGFALPWTIDIPIVRASVQGNVTYVRGQIFNMRSLLWFYLLPYSSWVCRSQQFLEMLKSCKCYVKINRVMHFEMQTFQVFMI